MTLTVTDDDTGSDDDTASVTIAKSPLECVLRDQRGLPRRQRGRRHRHRATFSFIRPQRADFWTASVSRGTNGTACDVVVNAGCPRPARFKCALVRRLRRRRQQRQRSAPRSADDDGGSDTETKTRSTVANVASELAEGSSKTFVYNPFFGNCLSRDRLSRILACPDTHTAVFNWAGSLDITPGHPAERARVSERHGHVHARPTRSARAASLER